MFSLYVHVWFEALTRLILVCLHFQLVRTLVLFISKSFVVNYICATSEQAAETSRFHLGLVSKWPVSVFVLFKLLLIAKKSEPPPFSCHTANLGRYLFLHRLMDFPIRANAFRFQFKCRDSI